MVMKFKDYICNRDLGGRPSPTLEPLRQRRAKNNECSEGWHHKLNAMCRRSHPNIYLFIQIHKKEQAANEAKIIQLDAGGIVRPKKRKYRQLDQRIQL